MVQHGMSSSSGGGETRASGWERPTVGSCATSAVTPAVAPTVDAISWRMTQDEGASSVKVQVRQAKSSLLSTLSSRGNKRLELRLISSDTGNHGRAAHHSEQKRKRIGSLPPFTRTPSGPGEDISELKVLWSSCCSSARCRLALGRLVESRSECGGVGVEVKGRGSARVGLQKLNKMRRRPAFGCRQEISQAACLLESTPHQACADRLANRANPDLTALRALSPTHVVDLLILPAPPLHQSPRAH